MTPEEAKRLLAQTAESAKTGKPHQGGGVVTSLKKNTTTKAIAMSKLDPFQDTAYRKQADEIRSIFLADCPHLKRITETTFDCDSKKWTMIGKGKKGKVSITEKRTYYYTAKV